MGSSCEVSTNKLQVSLGYEKEKKAGLTFHISSVAFRFLLRVCVEIIDILAHLQINWRTQRNLRSRCATCLVQINKNVSNFSFIYPRTDSCVQQRATSRDTLRFIIHALVTGSHHSELSSQARPEFYPLYDWLHTIEKEHEHENMNARVLRVTTMVCTNEERTVEKHKYQSNKEIMQKHVAINMDLWTIKDIT